jgi:plastocyanin
MRFFLLTAALIATAPVAATEQAARTTVTMANFSFSPENLHLHAGQRVTIHFVNAGSGGHDFTAPEFFAAATMDAADRGKLGPKGRVSLGRDESLDLTLIPKAGSYKAHCSHFMHGSLGMKGRIQVD